MACGLTVVAFLSALNSCLHDHILYQSVFIILTPITMVDK